MNGFTRPSRRCFYLERSPLLALGSVHSSQYTKFEVIIGYEMVETGFHLDTRSDHVKNDFSGENTQN